MTSLLIISSNDEDKDLMPMLQRESYVVEFQYDCNSIEAYDLYILSRLSNEDLSKCARTILNQYPQSKVLVLSTISGDRDFARKRGFEFKNWWDSYSSILDLIESM